ncbi:MAG: capsular biosynthesis protein [Thiohalospira sp.]
MSGPVLLLYNTPKARRYFRTLAAGVEVPRLEAHPLAVFPGSCPRDPVGRRAIADYSLRRKAARPTIPPWRQRLFRRLYPAVAAAHYAHARRLIRMTGASGVGVWGGQAVDVRAARAAAEDAGLPCHTFETGLLPRTTTCDPRGVNADSSVPRDPAFYRGLEADVALPEHLEQRPGRVEHPRVPLPASYIFVPFQVRLDSQILMYSPWIRDMRHLFRVMVKAWQAALAPLGVELVFKQHPSCREDYADLRERAGSLPGVHFANGNTTEELIQGAAGVVTVNSSVGLEALLLGRPVLTLGEALYAIPGVAEQVREPGGITAWLRAVVDGRPPADDLRRPFLGWLAREYCIPGSHHEPGPDHFAAVARRLAAGDRLVPAREGGSDVAVRAG